MKSCSNAVVLGLIAAGVIWLSSGCGPSRVASSSTPVGFTPSQSVPAPVASDAPPAAIALDQDTPEVIATRPSAPPPPDPAWSFAVLSDIHVSPSGKVARAFKQVVGELVQLKPRLVVIAGDSTNGNEDDKHEIARVRLWWKSLAHALAPLKKAGIPVFAIEGNHDAYRPVHRQGFAEAWSNLAADVAPITLSGNPPQNYSFDVDVVHFSMLHVVDQALDTPVKTWLRQDLSSPQAGQARLRFAFGHVPVRSVMGRSSSRFERSFGPELLKGRVSAYIAGHEHLFWDESLKIDGQALRQITVGTSSGTYTFPLNRETYAAHCKDSLCQLPSTKQSFALDPGTRQQKSKVTLLMVTINPDGYGTRFMALNGVGKLGPIAD